MTRLYRIGNLISGICMIGFSLLIVWKMEIGLPLVAAALSISFTLRGLRCLLFYFSMARSMVGGKWTLYRGIIFLDVGILTTSMLKDPAGYIILYIVALHLFSGIVDLLRARESKKVGAPSWKNTVAIGTSTIVLSVCMLIGGFIIGSSVAAVYGYVAGLVYSAIVRIISSFRRTEIVYIQ